MSSTMSTGRRRVVGCNEAPNDRSRRRRKCHDKPLGPDTQHTTKTSRLLFLYKLLVILIMILTFGRSALAGSNSISDADASNAIEDDELGKTLEGSGNEEWNLSHQTTSGSQLATNDESQWQDKAAKWLPTTTKAAITDPVEDVVKYSASERSLTSFAATAAGDQSNNNQTTTTRYGWKSSNNNEPIVSVIKISNNASSSPNDAPKVTHSTKEDKLNLTGSKSDGDEERANRNNIYKSYSIVASGGLKQNHPTAESSANKTQTPATSKMISYSPAPVQVAPRQLARQQVTEQPPEHRVVLTVASSPVPVKQAKPGNKNQQHYHHNHLAKILKAPLIITQDQLRMIADSDEPGDSSSDGANQKLFEGPRELTKDSFMFDASLLPISMSLTPASSTSVSASELMPQTASQFDDRSPFEAKINAMQTGDRHPQPHQHQANRFYHNSGAHNVDSSQLQPMGDLQYEPIVVETSPEQVSALDGQADGQQQQMAAGSSESNDGNSNGNSENSDTAQEQFDDENFVASDGPNVEPFDSDDQSMIAPGNKETKNRDKPTRLDTKHQVKKQQQQDKNVQLQPTTLAAAKPPEQELLVGPFKSESEAPATITLSGVVYQKSGSSSASIVKSAPKSAQPQPTPTVGPSNELANQGYWSNVTPIQVLVGTAQQQLSSVGDILLNSMKNGQLLTTGRDSMRVPSVGSLDGGLRLSPFAFSPGALLPASSNTISSSSGNGDNNQLLQGNSQLEFDFLNPPSGLATKMHFKQASSSLIPAEAISSMLLDSVATSASASSPSQEQQLTGSVGPVAWASSSNKGEQYFLGSLNAASSDYHQHQHMKHNAKTGPIVIVQKDVKPVKYHLLKAYLKLRRLLRPFEATYLFPNEHYPMMRRGQRSTRKMLRKLSSKEAEVAAAEKSPMANG